MIPAAFDYVRVNSTDEALAALAEHGDDAKLLAGGHSLLPLMKLRLATPAVVIDIGRVDELKGISDGGDHVAIGALTRHRDVEISDLVQAEAPLLSATTLHVGDAQVRHRGTIGGSIAHGDPASDIPSALIAMRATMVARGQGGSEREIAADDFFSGFLETALADDEVLTEIRVPKMAGVGYSYQKFVRRAQDWAIVGVAAVHGNGTTGVGLTNMDSRPVRSAAVEAALGDGANAADAAAQAAEGVSPSSDLNASVEYRQHLARVLTRRALEQAAG